MRGFGEGKLPHTRLSWGAMGISKGKLQSTMIIDQHGNEMHRYIIMNRIIIDENLLSPEFRNRIQKIIMFTSSAMLPALINIEAAYNENIKGEVQSFRNKGLFEILDRIVQIKLQNLCSRTCQQLMWKSTPAASL